MTPLTPVMIILHWTALQEQHCSLQSCTVADMFVEHLVQWLQESDGQAAMRRVLAAYSVHNESTGYCRSMNHIVGLLLVSLNRSGSSSKDGTQVRFAQKT